MSKMALYIGAFGLTVLRILPSVFMLFLTVVFVAVIVLQKAAFSIVRVALVTGAVLFTALCLVNVDGLVVRYNTDRYLAGTLTDYDTALLYRAGPAGVIPAVEVYESASDGTLKTELARYLKAQKDMLSLDAGTFCDTAESARALDAIEELPG